jgi:hypothetical protein
MLTHNTVLSFIDAMGLFKAFEITFNFLSNFHLLQNRILIVELS